MSRNDVLDTPPSHGGRRIRLHYTGGVHPWATHEVDPEGNCYWGHYFADMSSALLDFIERGRDIGVLTGERKGRVA